MKEVSLPLFSSSPPLWELPPSSSFKQSQNVQEKSVHDSKSCHQMDFYLDCCLMMDDIFGTFWSILAYFGICLKSNGGVEDVVVVDVCQCSTVRGDHRSDHFPFWNPPSWSNSHFVKSQISVVTLMWSLRSGCVHTCLLICTQCSLQLTMSRKDHFNFIKSEYNVGEYHIWDISVPGAH